MRKMFRGTLIFCLSFVFLLTGCIETDDLAGEPFNGESAFSFLETQMTFGPRIPGSNGHYQERIFITETLVEFGWAVETYKTEYQDKPVFNILAKREKQPGSETILIGAHYDTRISADGSMVAADYNLPVPGANDGASGVAVLLELARVLPSLNHLDVQLGFFDAEDNGYLPGWDWIVGSTQFANQLEHLPDAVVIVDMIGDTDQEIFYEKSSDLFLREEVWDIANRIGVASFIQEEKYHLIDDHSPFLNHGVPSVLIIDFDYPYWHTTEDTLDKVSPASLGNVGRVLQEWLIWRNFQEDW